MKRPLLVLAAALILVLTISDEATSRRLPYMVIDEVILDHPWGGEQNIVTPPATTSITPVVENDYSIIRIMKSWSSGTFFYSFFISRFESRGTTTTTTTITANDSNTGTDQATSQGGTGQ